jgi:hypothetical protein
MEGQVSTDVRRGGHRATRNFSRSSDRGRRLGAGGVTDNRATRKCSRSLDQGRRPAVELRHRLGVARIVQGGGRRSCASGLGSRRSRAGAPPGVRAGGGLAAVWSRRIFARFRYLEFWQARPVFFGLGRRAGLPMPRHIVSLTRL